MATVPPKHHQPLHNFSLPFLKWGQRIQVNNHCRRRYRSSPLTATVTDSSDSDLNNHKKPHRYLNRNSPLTGEKASVSQEKGTGTGTGKSIDVDVTTADDVDVKPWNLRPRRLVIDTVDSNGAAATVSCSKSVRLLRGVEEENEKDIGKKKRRLWISLSKEEIEEDVYAFTGSRPARRPKKRNRTAQKHVDVCVVMRSNCFPIQLSSQLI
ncbi:hypothetical protein L1987_03019 [Smallanthus sonchifolius]|uniref:Uncharacterized protein n=1 Tax=Smallanthus sonchifolius TaxID=185202 RepID=A0ACB9K9L1_9ASTR|nr:hypothetical protein L1987_03019 [Smallanthus sonchifolius]